VEVVTSVASLVLGLAVIVASTIVWIAATRRDWVDSDRFISHVSMAALELAGLAILISALAALFASH
jgi:hypothetical protein